MKEEIKIQYWNDPVDPVDHDKDTFWIKTAVEGAVGRMWYKNIANKRAFPDNLTITIDRDRGVVVISTN